MKKNNDNDRKKSNAFMYWTLMLTLIFLAVSVVLFVSMLKLGKEFNELKETTENQNKAYETEITNLQQKVTLLAEHLTVEFENKSIEEAKKKPVGIPVSGPATIISEPVTEDEGYTGLTPVQSNEVPFEDSRMNPYTLEISVVKGSKIIATGNGVVSQVSEDDIYGHIVKIDHGNGYVTIYRYDEEPKINQGDEVLKGQMIFEVTKYKGTLAYHILYENTYINPFDMIEISG